MSGNVGGVGTTPINLRGYQGLDGVSPGNRTTSTDETFVPDKSPGGDVPSGSVPILDEPTLTDGAALLNAYLALRVKTNNEQQKMSVEDLQAAGIEQKAKNEEVAKKMQEALEKMASAKAAGIFAKVFGWIAVALTVVAAIATGGALAFAAAAIAVTMATLTEAGVMDKITEAIAKSLQENEGMSEADSKKWAMGIMMGVTIAISLATLGAGIANTASAGAQAASTATNAVAKAIKAALEVVQQAMSKIAPAVQIGRMAQVAGSVATIGQQGAAIGGAVHTKEASDRQAETAELKKFLAILQQKLEDEADRLQQMIQQMQEGFANAMQIIGGQTDQQSETIRHMA
jgi:transloator